MNGFDTCYLSHLDAYRYEREDATVNHIRLGAVQNYLAVMLSGHSRFKTESSCVELFPGELLYIPRSCIYTSEWFGKPLCSFYSIGFIFTAFGENTRFTLQKLPDSDGRLSALVADIWHSSAISGPLALASFYSLYDILQKQLVERGDCRRQSNIVPALEYMEQHMAYRYDVPQLARLCRMSESAFYSAFREQTGFTPVEYKNILRCRAAADLLCTTDYTVETIAGMVGCSTAEYLRRLLLRATGKTPRQLRGERLTI